MFTLCDYYKYHLEIPRVYIPQIDEICNCIFLRQSIMIEKGELIIIE